MTPAGRAIEANMALVRRYMLEILNGRRLDELGEIAATDYLDHAALPGQGPGQAGLRHRIDLLVQALDPRWTILDLVADPTVVVVRWVLHGVHRGALLGLPPTGRVIALAGIDMYRVRDARFAEHWNVVDLSPLVVEGGGDDGLAEALPSGGLELDISG